jgi:hypothetical protein
VALAFVGIGVGLLALPALLPGQPADAQDLTSPAATGEKTEPREVIPKGTLGDQPRLDLYGDPLPKGAVTRLGTVRFRPGRFFSSAVEFLGDGKTIVTGGEDGKLRFWDAATGKLRHAIGVLGNEIRCMALAPDGKTCAVAGPRGCGQTPLDDAIAQKNDHVAAVLRMSGAQVSNPPDEKGA